MSMGNCMCGMFETCDVCIALAERDLGPYTAENYARHCRIAVDPAAPDGHDETAIIYSELCFQTVQERAHALLTGTHDKF